MRQKGDSPTIIEAHMHKGNAMKKGICYVMLCTISAFAGTTQPSTQPSATDKRVERVLKADSPRDLAAAYRGLFDRCTAEELRELVAHPDCTVALGAGWERVRRTLPEKQQQKAVPPDANELYRFLGLVEGRTHVPLPLRWTSVVLSAQSAGRGVGFVFPTPKGWYDPKDYPADVEEEHPTCRWEGDQWKVTIDGKTWSAPRGVDYQRNKQAVASVGDTLFLASYDSRPLSYAVYAVDRQTDKTIWWSNVWAEGGLVGYSGRGWHDVQLRVRRQHLVVFGIGDSVVYIEAFDVKTGQSLYRFCISYYVFGPPVPAEENGREQPNQ